MRFGHQPVSKWDVQPRPVDVTGLEKIQNGWARFLANGEWLIANGNELGHATRCYVLRLTGGKPKAVTPEGILCGPSSPDSQLVIGVGPNSDLAVYPIEGGPIEGGPPRPIPGLKAGFRPVQWSEDGRVLYGYQAGELPSKIYKVDIATGKETMMRELRPGSPAGVVTVSPVVVSRDGTRYAYSYNQTLSVLFLISGLQ